MTPKKTLNKKAKSNLIFLILFSVGSILLALGSAIKIIPFSLIEDFGFISGALTVWLTVKENIWNWPIGIINAVFFIILFLQSRLYADMALQLVYVVLGFLGWYWWLKGGPKKTELKISNTPVKEFIILVIIGVFSTALMTLYLRSISDSAPFLDGLTTVLSLLAQYMLTKKFLQNWHVWITADIIYIGLYIYKNLYLTGFLYLIFLIMCLIGLKEWNNTLKNYRKA